MTTRYEMIQNAQTEVDHHHQRKVRIGQDRDVAKARLQAAGQKLALAEDEARNARAEYDALDAQVQEAGDAERRAAARVSDLRASG